MPLFSVEDIQNEMNKQCPEHEYSAIDVLNKLCYLFTIIDGQVYMSIKLHYVFTNPSYCIRTQTKEYSYMKIIDHLHDNGRSSFKRYSFHPNLIEVGDLYDSRFSSDPNELYTFGKAYITLTGGNLYEYLMEKLMNCKNHWMFRVSHAQICSAYNDWFQVNHGFLNGEKMETFDQILERIFGENKDAYLTYVKERENDKSKFEFEYDLLMNEKFY